MHFVCRFFCAFYTERIIRTPCVMLAKASICLCGRRTQSAIPHADSGMQRNDTDLRHDAHSLFTSFHVLHTYTTQFKFAERFFHQMATQPIRLTAREMEILELIYLGNTDIEIAEQIDISKNTVRTHRENIRTKFKVNNTVSMIREAIKLKLIG